MIERRAKKNAIFISFVLIMFAFFLNWLFTISIEKASSQDIASKLLQLSYSFCVLCVVIIEVMMIELIIIKSYLKIVLTDINSKVFLLSLILGFCVFVALPAVFNIDTFRNYITTNNIGRYALLVAIC